jgi:hypothetical protein
VIGQPVTLGALLRDLNALLESTPDAADAVVDLAVYGETGKYRIVGGALYAPASVTVTGDAVLQLFAQPTDSPEVSPAVLKGLLDRASEWPDAY